MSTMWKWIKKEEILKEIMNLGGYNSTIKMEKLEIKLNQNMIAQKILKQVY